MNLKKKASVVMLPTKDETTILLFNDNTLKKSTSIVKNAYDILFAMSAKYQHIHILSDEKIEDGDWCINTNLKISEPFIKDFKFDSNDVWYKKIIASTDKSLNLPEPSPTFINKFVDEYNKGNIIKLVNVEYKFITTNEDWSKQPVQLDGYDKIKTDKNNFITITKIKDSWNKQEIIDIIMNFADEFVANTDTAYKKREINEWIETNLKN